MFPIPAHESLLRTTQGPLKKRPRSPNHISARALAGGPPPFTARSIPSCMAPELTHTTRYAQLAHLIPHTIITVESSHFCRTTTNKPSPYHSVTPLTFRCSATFSMGPGPHQKRACAHAEFLLRRRTVFPLASKVQRQCCEHLQAVTRPAKCYSLASVPKAIATDCLGIIYHLALHCSIMVNTTAKLCGAIYCTAGTWIASFH